VLLGLGAFLAVTVVPGLKYPANPPSVGDPDTIANRTELFFAMLVISLAALVLAVALARALRSRYGARNAILISGAVYVAFVVIAQIALPSVNEIPEQFSAALLWRFRAAAVGIQLILWATTGFLFGVLTEHGVAPPFRGLFTGLLRGRARSSRGPALRA